MSTFRSGRPAGRARRASALVALLAAGALAGCEDGLSMPFGEGESAAATGGQSVELVERDVEAPEIFQVTEPGVWDGRPSFGGVWVAHPDVGDPGRVIIRNTETGDFVIGALFRRERENPGPALQVSSEAAAALGMLAGAPATLNVTALRREEASSPEPTEATAPEAVLGEDGAEGAAMDAPGEVTTSALAPAGATEPGTTPAPAPAPAPAADPAPPPAPAAPAPATAASDLSRPYVQLGIFSVEENASGAEARMADLGLPTRVVREESGGRSYWRVLVGPAGSESERAGFLSQVTGAGFADAYPVRN
ncbi:SPOR domain-containing protein [Wenxinia saemankumensis]|uniref:Sporulation related domain-containing protein n=1 Tax=Wenxinia saemankumensis TaxID=1447782 RepID=A0A1M6HAA2_9RHOB|nr:SPOR domain-containing protein [Wenxinia saemankumensis]SHJ19004.1 Sporulation related domain-containing protein [Wenxinia saemankumensis]